MTLLITILLTLFRLDETKEVFHDFHLSRCEINFESKSGDLQIAAHIFIDDFEDALALGGKKDLHIGTQKESPKGDEAIEQYINQKLILKSLNKAHKLSLIGKEVSKDKMAVWCYFEVIGLKNLTNIDIENKILTEVFNDQKNIVDFTVDNKKKHFTIFDAKKVKAVYEW
jgi:hypothetical protein